MKPRYKILCGIAILLVLYKTETSNLISPWLYSSLVEDKTANTNTTFPTWLYTSRNQSKRSNFAFPWRYASQNDDVPDDQLLKLQEGENCWKGNVKRTGILQRIDEQLQYEYALEEFLEGPGFDFRQNETRAACKLIPDRFTSHFPHFMQQVYRCFSWWRANSDKEPLLVLPGNQPIETEFLKGMMELLREVFGVRMVHKHDDLKIVQAIFTYYANLQHSYAMKSSHDANVMRDAFLERLGLEEAKTCRPKVRIRILSRKNNRSIQNAEDLVKTLEKTFLGTIGRHEVESISVATFEAASFRDQLEFLSQADILISVHGAALTGIPFQPKCAAVLELFPGGYAVPLFFGSLAAVSGVSHSFMYLGHQDMEREKGVGMK
jgi:hypothetical protein